MIPSSFPLQDHEEKSAAADREPNYNIVWHWNDAFRRYETYAFDLAVTKWNSIPNPASRVFLIHNKVHKAWYHNEKWKDKMLQFVKSEGFQLQPVHVLVIWHDHNDDHQPCEHSVFQCVNKAHQFYNDLKSQSTKASLILSVDYCIKDCCSVNKEKQKFVTDRWWKFILDEHKTYYAAFSHRDSDQSEPLFGALRVQNGNIEFDVHLIDGQLRIGHDRKHCKKGRTLQSLYLNPLRDLIRQNRLKRPVNLYVDMKSAARDSYLALHELLWSAYSDLVTSWRYDAISQSVVKQQRLVNIVITGARDVESILKTPNKEMIERFVAIDGRIEDIERHEMHHEYVPMISDQFKKVFPGYHAKKDYILNDKEKAKLKVYITKCRERKQRLRFWGTKDSENLWQQLIDLDLQKDVIVINTDDQGKLLPFLIRNGY